ncbi:hypothetical protein DM867_00325 [Halosegnis rubeus]|jgi:hypothetical protein|uniref:Uncharacterized protein n=1 Tax=Halosegnis rubeus TaxID=2212850 RepID=A0A5N5UDX3_9EURY|nr:hypothetical protein [Halosegnis rubeus]KAB7515632.1 hypothetical protein DM867_00325 [Halosegnis rubeus]KAB7517162.1 hypothetical protein DMP03_07355 [Halosegnis rubeus]
MDLDQFADDAPEDDADPDARCCVVATRQATFGRCRDGIYPSPRSYDRTRREFEYMAFYRTAPVSEITHYAPVEARVEQTRGESGPVTDEDWETLIDPFSDERVVVVFQLGELVPLNSPVENDRNGVRGAWYCSIEDLRAAGTLSALAECSET